MGVLGRTPFALHMVALVLSLATALALWILAREVLGRDDAATWTVVLFSIIPVFAAGSMLTAPDGPLFFCWVMTLLWTWRAANGTRGGAWLAAGGWLGLALQSKYAAVALPVSVGLWLLLSPAHRRWLTRPEPSSPWQAARLGGRIPIPVLGPGWDAARRIAEIAGAPVPPHVVELLRHGRAGDGARARDMSIWAR